MTDSEVTLWEIIDQMTKVLKLTLGAMNSDCQLTRKRVAQMIELVESHKKANLRH